MTALLDEAATTIVTGGSGWFGRAFLAAIRDGEGDTTGPVGRSGVVRALVPDPGDVEAVLSVLPRAQVHVGDVTEPSALKRLFADGAGASVVHAAGVIHPQRVADFEAVNADGTAGVLAAAKDAGVRRFVHVSSNSPFGVNPTPTDTFRHDEPYHPYLGYGRSKMLAEERVRAAHSNDFETVIVRPPWFYGPWQPLRQTTFFRLIRTGKFPLIGDGSQRRSMVYVDNLVQGVALAERHPAAAGDAFWIADERPYTMLEILATVKQALRDEGFDVADRQVKLPGLASRVAERIDRVLQGRGIYHQEFHVLGEMDKTIACDIAYSRDVLGFDPKIELHEGMRRSIRWCIEQGVQI
ncbi:MAG: NAD(P)-dependent oxidoreductase [Nocardioidaceae bacterium]|nr:NAD(P)-dependent oxidoreductase [Nocardioidaceae bacterium]